jgi:hypothetical protein
MASPSATRPTVRVSTERLKPKTVLLAELCHELTGGLDESLLDLVETLADRLVRFTPLAPEFHALFRRGDASATLELPGNEVPELS